MPYFMDINKAVSQLLTAAQPEIEKLVGEPVTFGFNKGGSLYAFHINSKKGDPIDGYGSAYFYLTQMPGCCAILVSHNVSVGDVWRGKGLGKLLLDIRLKAARLAGYTKLAATTNQNNTREIHILQKAGFEKKEEFKSIRTGNTVFLWVRETL